ncbi:hypothetical protein PAENIP36_41650 [Paenibacillus sp. P36]
MNTDLKIAHYNREQTPVQGGLVVHEVPEFHEALEVLLALEDRGGIYFFLYLYAT